MRTLPPHPCADRWTAGRCGRDRQRGHLPGPWTSTAAVARGRAGGRRDPDPVRPPVRDPAGLSQALGADPVDGDMFPVEEPFAHLAPGPPTSWRSPRPRPTSWPRWPMAWPMTCSPARFVLRRTDHRGPGHEPQAVERPGHARELGEAAGPGRHRPGAGVGQRGLRRRGRGRLVHRNHPHGRPAGRGPQDMVGRRVLVSLGPTREFWDPIRFLSNPSSGTMGGPSPWPPGCGGLGHGRVRTGGHLFSLPRPRLPLDRRGHGQGYIFEGVEGTVRAGKVLVRFLISITGLPPLMRAHRQENPTGAAFSSYYILLAQAQRVRVV